jgi:hypothetical protein
MRIWSLHPSLLDQKGLTAVWRETLLAKHVLEGKTKGYKNHPQLLRFKQSTLTLPAINYYLSHIQQEATTRGYNFDKSKIDFESFEEITDGFLTVNNKQLEYEFQHLLKKLQLRDTAKFDVVKNTKPHLHPLFKLVEGGVEGWEIL